MSNSSSTDNVGSVASVYDSYIEKQLLAALLSLICIVGVIGNGSVLLAVVLSRKPRTSTNVFVVNLAVADLFTCVSLPIMTLAVLSASREKLLVADSLCALQGFVVIVCVGCSLNNIATIAFLRAVITRRKNTSGLAWLFNRRILATGFVANWLIPIVVGILPIVSEFGSYEYDDKTSTCTFNPTADGSATFSRIMFALYYPVQLIVTFTGYAVIFYTVRKHVRRVNAGPLPLALQDATAENRQHAPATIHLTPIHPPPAHRQPAPDPARPYFRRKIDVNLTLFLVVFFFLISVSPYMVAAVFPEFTPKKIKPFLGALVLSNSCINPVIYTVRHPDFKAVIRCILLCRLSKIPMKSSFLASLLRAREEREH